MVGEVDEVDEAWVYCEEEKERRRLEIEVVVSKHFGATSCNRPKV